MKINKRKILDVKIPNSKLVNSEIILKMPIDNMIYKTYIADGFWGREEICILNKFSFNSTTYDFVDVGANVGLLTLYFSKYFNIDNTVAFEPDTELFSCLEYNTRNIKKISLNNFGLDIDSGERKFYTDNLNHGNNSLYKNAELIDHGYRESTIRIENTTDVFLNLNLKNKIIYKSDTQGNDIKIISNIPHAFWDNVDFCLVEFWNINNESLDVFFEKFKKFKKLYIGKVEYSFDDFCTVLINLPSNKQVNLICGI